MKIADILGQRWWLAVPVLIAMALPIWATQLEAGWLEMTFGHNSAIYWFAALAWLVLTVAGIRHYRAWWLLITAPIVLFPIIVGFGLFMACSRGDCL